MPESSRTFRRITVTDWGIAKKGGWFFGEHWAVQWDDITGWALSETRLQSTKKPGPGTLVSRNLELHLKRGLHIRTVTPERALTS